MVKKTDWFELSIIGLCLLFAISISLFHLSYDGYLGLSQAAWDTVWAFAENGFSIVLCLIVSVATTGILRVMFRYLFIPYFALKLIYHFTCYSGLYLFSPFTWEVIWSIILVGAILILLSLIYYKKYVD